MNTISIVRFPACRHQFASWGLDDVFYHSQLKYSIRNLSFTCNINTEVIIEALQRSFRVCNLLGIDSQHHFMKKYLYNSQMKVVEIDWMMSKIGLNLMVMQLPSLNEQMAKWLWELASL